MRVGVMLPNILSPVHDPETLQAVARLSEDSGFDSIWVSDHIIMPSQYERYGSGSEALITLAYLAALTERVELGISVLILPMRNPLVAAKQIASLDVLAGGRTILGVGVGWCKEEFDFLNADFHQRGDLTDEYLEIMWKLWTEESPQHDGTYTFSDVLFNPKPARVPPLYIGGTSDSAIRRAAAIGDGWQPIYPISNYDYRAKAVLLRELAGERPVTMSAYMKLNMHEGSQKVLDTLMELSEIGLEYPVLVFDHETRTELTQQIEQFAADILPEVK